MGISYLFWRPGNKIHKIWKNLFNYFPFWNNGKIFVNKIEYGPISATGHLAKNLTIRYQLTTSGPEIKSHKMAKSSKPCVESLVDSV